MYLDGVAMPITPSKVEVKIANQNSSLNLIDGTEINILKEPGLSKVSFELLLGVFFNTMKKSKPPPEPPQKRKPC